MQLHAAALFGHTITAASHTRHAVAALPCVISAAWQTRHAAATLRCIITAALLAAAAALQCMFTAAWQTRHAAAPTRNRAHDHCCSSYQASSCCSPLHNYCCLADHARSCSTRALMVTYPTPSPTCVQARRQQQQDDESLKRVVGPGSIEVTHVPAFYLVPACPLPSTHGLHPPPRCSSARSPQYFHVTIVCPHRIIPTHAHTSPTLVHTPGCRHPWTAPPAARRRRRPACAP